MDLLTRLVTERKHNIPGGIYHKLQVEMTYNSNRIEGSKISEDQTRLIFETNTINFDKDSNLKIDDAIETVNHFECIKYVIDTLDRPLTEGLIKELHKILKTLTSDSRLEWFVVGDYKKIPNEVGGKMTTKPEKVESEICSLINNYNNKNLITVNDIIEFHYNFECIHPFQDGNGRVGRLIVLRECLKNDIVPFIIEDEIKSFYYRGLREFDSNKGYLIDTCLSAQDKFKKYLDYFEIEYIK